VFAQPTGAPIDSRADRRDWDQLFKYSDVRPGRLHDARHTAATTLLIMGVPARVVMQIFRHSHIGLTLGTYSHVVPELATGAAGKITQA
jgi:integrase